MKNLKAIVFTLMLFFALVKTSAQTFKIDASKSKITWVGKKITGQHEGIVNIKDGYLIFKNKKVVGGKFTVDMTSLSNTDQTGNSKAKLEGHLKSNDFFDTVNYKTSTLVFKNIVNKDKNTYVVTADLSIKGITNSIKFDFLVTGKKATAALIIDRTKFNIRYGSGSYFDDLGDQTIYDEFELNVVLVY